MTLQDPTQDVSLSIVIAAYNEEGNLEDVVRTVLGVLESKYSTYEIVIVDDASTDSTGKLADQLAAKHPQVKVLHNDKNGGMGFSLWRGMKSTSMDYVGSFPGDRAMDGKG